MAANYFLAFRSGVLRGSKSVGEKIKLTRFAESNFDWKNCNRRQE
jgi:hypothetical protein